MPVAKRGPDRPAKYKLTPGNLGPRQKHKPRKPQKEYTEGKRITVYLKPEQLKIYDQLENKSKFLQLAVQEAVGIMTWANLKARKPEEFYDVNKFEDVIDEYNENYPSEIPPDLKRHQEKKERERIRREDPRGDPGPDSELW